MPASGAFRFSQKTVFTRAGSRAHALIFSTCRSSSFWSAAVISNVACARPARTQDNATRVTSFLFMAASRSPSLLPGDLLELCQVHADDEDADGLSAGEDGRRDLDVVLLRDDVQLGRSFPGFAGREGDVELRLPGVKVADRLLREGGLLAPRGREERPHVEAVRLAELLDEEP